MYKNNLCSKIRDVVHIFNKHFSTIGQKLSRVFGRNEKAVLSQPITTTKFELDHVSTEFVQTQLRGLKNKAIGLDKISARLLKDGASFISPALVKLTVNLSINQRCFPNNWKSAKVVTLFKAGDRSDPNNYRPISILPTVSKIIEKAVHSQLHAYLQDNKLPFVRQFGFSTPAFHVQCSIAVYGWAIKRYGSREGEHLPVLEEGFRYRQSFDPSPDGRRHK